jgi:choline dehydrogenase-like flavoprotein
VTTVESNLVVVGSGVTGVLAAEAVLAAGRRVTMLERGGYKPHADQLRDRAYTLDVLGAQPNHDREPGTPEYPWSYLYGVGGSCLHWTGNTPRLSEADLRMRSAYGVMEDWPISLEELVPHYRRAERLLGVAGAPDRPGDRPAMPAHPFSPLDQVLAPLLDPYVPLPQARPTIAIGARAACCASGMCELCPVDARFSVLNGLGRVLAQPALDLRTETVVERVLIDGRRAVGVRCIGPDGSRYDVRAPLVVLAAGGFENPALLLRSGLDRPDTGRFLFDHAHRTLWIEVDRELDPGRGSSLSTGVTEAFREGAFRSRVGGAYVSTYNPGLPPEPGVVDALLARRGGRRVAERARERWRHTVVLDALLDDQPQAARRVTLSPVRDALGLPRVRVAYPPPTHYEERGWAQARDGVLERLRPLGVRSFTELPGPAGAHLLGTCRIGGVVDADQRHLDVDNLFVAGGSAFPTYSPVHPTLTIAALALRLGALLAG